MTGKEISTKLKERKLTVVWLVDRLADRGFSTTSDCLRKILGSERSNQIVHEANDILLTYDKAFKKPTFKVGDFVEGESKYGEYISGRVFQTRPELLIETERGFREPCYRAKAYTPTAR